MDVTSAPTTSMMVQATNRSQPLQGPIARPQNERELQVPSLLPNASASAPSGSRGSLLDILA